MQLSVSLGEPRLQGTAKYLTIRGGETEDGGGIEGLGSLRQNFT